MSKTKKKIPKSKQQLEKDLLSKNKYLEHLLSSIEDYDPGDEIRDENALNVAVILRLLFHRTRTQKPLLEQLGILDKLYMSSEIIPLAGPNNIVPESKLTITRIKNDSAFFVCKKEFEHLGDMSFETWWNEIVIDNKDVKDNLVSRKEIVLALANKEGAHVDPNYDEKYYKICVNKGFNIGFQVNDQTVKYQNNPYKEIVFSIAQEYLISYKKYCDLNGYFKLSENNTEDVFISMYKEYDNKVSDFRRYFIWYRKSWEDFALNWIHVDKSNDAKYYFSFIKKLRYKSKTNNMFYEYYLFDDSNKTPTKLVFDELRKVLALIFVFGGKYIIMRGSYVGRTTTIKNIVVEKNSYFYIMNDYQCDSKEEMFSCLGINPFSF